MAPSQKNMERGSLIITLHGTQDISWYEKPRVLLHPSFSCLINYLQQGGRRQKIIGWVMGSNDDVIIAMTSLLLIFPSKYWVGPAPLICNTCFLLRSYFFITLMFFIIGLSFVRHVFYYIHVFLYLIKFFEDMSFITLMFFLIWLAFQHMSFITFMVFLID